ncbi:MAG TPA: DUF4232 domain-containing protein [Streptosporangiaceae bacterium]|nr:DUF4232 domain-containing protein [Streptosporangiaceae bacterium]
MTNARNRSPLRASALAAASGLAATALLAACSTAGGHPGASSQSAGRLLPSPSHVAQFLPPESPAATASPAATSQPAPPVPAAAGPAACAASQLQLSVGPENGAAGSLYYPVQFTNTSDASCTLYGYPGVALVSAPGGSIVGAAAVRNPTFPAALITIAPGGVAHAPLQVALAANYPAPVCGPATAHWLQVYPPGSFTALFVDFTAQTCTKPVGDGSTLGIYVVLPGATGS